MSIRSTATKLGALVGAAALLGGLALTAAPAFAQPGATPTASPLAVTNGGPAQVPSARFFGTVNGSAGATVVAQIGGVACGFGTVSGGSYSVDVQFIPGCNTPGATVSFTVNGATASPTGTLPSLEGTAVMVNLSAAQATASPAPVVSLTPPPPPSRTSTPTLTPPPPPPTTRPVTSTATPRTATPRTATPPSSPTKTMTPRPVTAVPTTISQKPTGPAISQKPTGPAISQKPATGAQAPAGVQLPAAAGAQTAAPAGVRLPSTGNGGVTGNGTMGFGLLSILLGALTLTGASVVAFRRSR